MKLANMSISQQWQENIAAIRAQVIFYCPAPIRGAKLWIGNTWYPANKGAWANNTCVR